ncbi:MAG: Hint domain-containing protein [Paracoccaceae bacterium]
MTNFSDQDVSNLVGLWDFTTGHEYADTGLDDGIAQNGFTGGGVHFSNGQLVTDGKCAFFSTHGNDAPFDLDSGTLEVQFTQSAHDGHTSQSIVNRGEMADVSSEGYFSIQVTGGGRVQVIHCNPGVDSFLQTDANFFEPGDTVKITYVWDDESGATLLAENTTTGETQTLTSTVQGLSMDIGDNDDENFTFGAREYDDGCNDQFFEGAIDYVAIYDADMLGGSASGNGDGVVSGTVGADVIDAGYVGDDEGDRIDAGDALLPGETDNDDIVLAGAGNDTIIAGDGDDEVLAGTGDDSVLGQDGDDSIQGGFGDDTLSGGEGSDTLIGGVDSATQTLDFEDLQAGDIVSSQFADQGVKIWSWYESNPVMVFDTNNPTGGDHDLSTSNLGNVLILSEDGDSSDPDDNYAGGHMIFDFAEPSTVSSVRLLDIDEGATVRLYDEDGTQIACFDHLCTHNNGQLEVSMDVCNVSRMVVSLCGSGALDNLVFFPDQPGEDDDDVLDGGAGDDVLLGNRGDDTLDGGSGADQVDGGADRDVILGGAGDTVDGGASGDDYDILDLTGQGPFILRDVQDDGNGNGIDGTVVFVDADGVPTGETLEFTEIEEIRGDDVTTDAPTAVDDTAQTPEDTPVTIPVLDNDTDPTGQTLTLSDADSPNGDVTVNPDGTVTFDPDPDFNGETTITYTVTDPDGNTDTGTVTITVTPVNDAPDAVDDADETAFETPVTVDLLANDSDVDGDDLSVVSASVPAAEGTLLNNGDGTVTFTPADGFTGTATISYTIEDEEGLQDSAVHTIEVGTNAPTAVDDTATTLSNTSVVIDALANDTDPNADELVIISASVPPEQGSVEIVDDKIVFTPALDFEGQATISYTIEDEDDLTDDAIVTVTVRNGIVNGTQGGDLINSSFVEDPGGDMVDAGDEILPGEGLNDDIIQAGDGHDTIIAGEGDDEVFGGEGDDDITTGTGADSVDGGDGDDLIDTDSGSFLIDKGYPDVFAGEEGTDAALDDRDTVVGGDGDDTIRTGDDADVISGGTGQDEIDGGIDDDVIDGGADDDRIVGGEGSDSILGGAGSDLIFAGNDPDLGLDQFDIEDDGTNPLGPDLRPDNGRDTVLGGAGNDTIFGADDDDSLSGGTGNDFVDGQIDDDFVEGNQGDDTLLGGQGDDTLSGGAGNDQLDGGSGADVLDGDADRDTFTGLGAGDTVDGGSEGDDFDTLDLTGSAGDGSLKVTLSGPDSNGNGFDGVVTYFDSYGKETGQLEFSEIEDIVPCFTPGTLIATPSGEVPVDQLQVGDRVITRDNGIQQIRWVGARALTEDELNEAKHLRPVRIPQGALGKGLPERDMLVSPQHRMLMSNDKTMLLFDEREVLVAAKHLSGLEGIEVADLDQITYVHLMFDHHEVILSDGAWSESFQPGDQTLGAMGNAQRKEIIELFPELQTKAGREAYTAARRSLKKHEARLLTL